MEDIYEQTIITFSTRPESNRIEKHTTLLHGNRNGLSIIFVALNYVTSTCESFGGRLAALVGPGAEH